MSDWITAGRGVDEALPAERMTEKELGELRRLLSARQVLQERLMVADQQLELLMLAVRDGRGLQGPIKADPETGRILCEGKE